MIRAMIRRSKVDYLFRIVTFCVRRQPLFWVILGTSAVSSIVELMAIMSLRPLADLSTGKELNPNDPLLRLFTWLGIDTVVFTLLLAFLGLFALRVATALAVSVMNFRLARTVQGWLSALALDAVLSRISLQAIEATSIGHYQQLAGDEAGRVGQILLNLLQMVTSSGLALLYFSYIVYVSPIAAISVISFMALTSIVLAGVFLKIHRLGRRMIAEGKTATTIFIDAINGLRAVKSYRAEDYTSTQYRHSIEKYMGTQFSTESLNLFAKALPVLLLFLFAGTLVVFRRDTLSTDVDLAFLLAIVASLMRFFPAVGMTLTSFTRVLSDARAGEDILEIVSYQRKEPLKHDEEKLGGLIKEIVFEDVDFAYRPEHPVLRKFSLALCSGHSYVFLGPSGVGKSTVADLLLKFYEPAGGTIRVNGILLAEISEHALRERVLLVGQRDMFFNDTIANNLRLGMQFTTDEIEQACRQACVHDVIAELPNGYETILHYQGSNLSGGQRQRLGIARAILRDPDVLILDESTNALDEGTKATVLANIRRKFSDRLLVFITHDRDVTSDADVIRHLGNGKTLDPVAAPGNI